MYKQRGRSLAVSGSRPEDLISSHLNSGLAPPDPIYSSDSTQHGTIPQTLPLYQQYPLLCEPYDQSYNPFEGQANISFQGNGMGGQPAPNFVPININLFQNDFMMYPDQQPMGQSSSPLSKQDMSLNRYATPASLSQGSKSTTHSYSPDLPSVPKPVAEPSSSKRSFPVTSNEYRYVPSHYSKAVASAPMASLQSTKRERLSPQVSTLQWIAEDPTSKQRHHEKRVRTQLDVENRKEEIQKLKEFGGACLWCHRSKKKCDPAQNCQPCRANKRKCVRSSSQLCLIGHFNPTHDSLMSFGPPSQEALNIMYLMADQAFSDMPFVKAHLNIQHENRLPCLAVTKDDMDPFKSETRRLMNDFIFRASTRINSPELEKLTGVYSTHPLVLTAIKMTKSFITIRNLATTRVHLCTSDTRLAQSTLFLLLIASLQNLAAASNSFTLVLCEALRRRNYDRTNPATKHQPPGSCSPSPVSLATEVYFQIVGGLLELTESPIVALIFKNVEQHLQEVHATLKSILASINANHPKSAEHTIKRIPGERIAAISSIRYFELSFWVEWVDTNGHIQSTTAIEQGYAPELTSLEVEALLQTGIDNLGSLEKSTKEDEISPVSAEVPAQSISTETETDHASNTDGLDSPSAESGIFDDILNSTPWDWVVADDELYFGFMDQ
ncbi:hypothetical protein N7513_005063 [Penicillium frequentans]|nr:hypothetical protein N7513_005063 [Penicillium glabrum]